MKKKNKDAELEPAVESAASPGKRDGKSLPLLFPLIMEATFSVATAVLMIVTCIIAVLSLLAEIPWYAFILRVGGTVLGLGFFLYLFARTIMGGWVQAVYMQHQQQPKQDTSLSGSGNL